tara:strand:- start:1380 stop:2606 length:1227 start_codon:yes stop_codon:yes gene_type:complete
MHIAMISGEYPPRWGGMGSTVFHLSSKLAEMGHRVTVITRRSGGNPPIVDGVSVIGVPWAKIPMSFTRSYGRHALRELIKINERDNVDVVHLHCPMVSWDDKQFSICHSKVAPVVSSMHGTWLGERDGLLLAAKFGEPAVWSNPNDIAIRFLAKRYARFENSAVRNSAIVVPNSHATKIDLETRYDAPDNWDCEVVHWGVDTQMFVPPHRDSEDQAHFESEMRGRYSISSETMLVLAVGRLAARKGHGMLLRSFKRASDTTDVHLVIIGRGSLKRRLTKMASSLGIGDKVSIESEMDFEGIAEMYRSADVVAYPSYYEGQGLIPLEAMASGTPVVTVDHGPLPEMVDESVGALFEMGSEEALAQAIVNECSSREILLKKGSEGRNRVMEKFTLLGNAESFLEIYDRAR